MKCPGALKDNRGRRILGVCILAELLILLICAGIAVFRDNKVYTCEAQDFVKEDGYLDSMPISLPKGVYRVVLQYSCEGTMQYFCNVESLDETGRLLCSGEHLSEGLGYTNFDLWIKGRGTEAVVRIQCGEGNVQIHGLTIRQTSQDMTRLIFLFAMFFLLADSLCIYRLREKNAGVFREKKQVFTGLCVIIFCSSIPLLVDYIYSGSDITYHLLRIGNIKEGLLEGQFPVRIDPSWLYGHGYASSVCYGDIFLYIPAFLRILGFDLQESYAFFLFFINVATCLISYFGFRSVFQDWRIGLFCSAVYTLSVYRLFKMYSWGAIGEAQSMVFLPLIFCAVYHIFVNDTETETYGRLWIPLGTGFAGIIQCHVLTVELTLFFLVVTCLVLWKRLFRRKTFLVFLKGALWASALSAWFVIPFLDYYFNVDMIIHHVSARTIQEVGLYPANLLFAFFLRGSTRDFMTNGMQNMEALGIGLPLTLTALCIMFLWFFGYMEERSGLKSGAKLALVLGGSAMLMSLSCFPWTRIQFLNGITEKLVSSIQYPNRFLMVATLLLSFATGACAIVLGESFGKKAGAGYMAVFCVSVLVTAFYYQSSIIRDTDSLCLYDEKGMGTGYLSGAEYLRYGLDQAELSFHGPVCGEGVEVLHYDKEGLKVKLDIRNSGKDSYVDVPLQYYKGYTAVSDTTGKRMEIGDGSHYDIRIQVPEGFEGGIRVCFESPWYWRIGEIISVLALTGIAVWNVGGCARRKLESR